MILSIEGDQNAIISALEGLPGVKTAVLSKTNPDLSAEYVVNYDKNEDVRKIVFAKMAEISCPIISMKNDNMTLEDIFRKLTDESDANSEADKIENGGEK